MSRTFQYFHTLSHCHEGVSTQWVRADLGSMCRVEVKRAVSDSPWMLMDGIPVVHPVVPGFVGP